MQIKELLQLTKWFQETIIDSKISNMFSLLHNKMNQNLKKNNNQVAIPFETEKNKLLNALEKLHTDSLTLEQIAFLEKLEVLSLLGQKGAEQIKSIFTDHRLDIVSATTKVKECSQKMTTAVQTLTELNTVLIKSFPIDEIENEIPNGSTLMRIYFRQDVAINNIVDLKKLANIWHEIGRGVTMAQNKSPEDFKIIGAQKGSIIIEMAVLTSIAVSVSTILLSGLKVAEKVVGIMLKIQEIKNMKLNNKKIATELEKEAKEQKEKGIDNIVNELIIKLNLENNQEGDKITALKKSVQNLVNFSENGGIVDFVEPLIDEENDEDEKTSIDRQEVLNLKNNIEKIRLIDSQVKLLEAKARKKE